MQIMNHSTFDITIFCLFYCYDRRNKLEQDMEYLRKASNVEFAHQR